VVRGKKATHVIIVGGPGTGKTTLTNLLQKELTKQGLKVYVIRDWAREIIIEQKAKGGNLLPWINRVAFEREVVRRHVREYENLYTRGEEKKYDVILEDGSPFIAPAYAEADGEPPDEWITGKLREWAWIVDAAILTTPLNNYGTDNARWENKQYALKIHETIRKHINKTFPNKTIQLTTKTPEARLAETLGALVKAGLLLGFLPNREKQY